MQYLKTDKLTFEYIGQETPLFENINLEINKNDKIGLIGKNGCGKTTLFNLLQGNLAPSSGAIHFRNSAHAGTLPQEIKIKNGITVKDFLWTAKPGLLGLKQTIDTTEDFSKQEALDTLADFEEKGGYVFEANFEKQLSVFELSPEFLERSVSTLSGGEKTKVALCRLVLSEPDFLLLDEPTNHLDLETLLWLEDYLKKIRMPFVVISHDRKFLDNCVTQVWELEGGELRSYSGNYSLYKEEKDKEFALQMHQYETQQKKLKQLKKTASERRKWAGSYQAETGKDGNAPVFEMITNPAKHAMKRARNVEKRMDMMIEREEAKKPHIEKKRGLIFEDSDLKNKFVLRVSDLSTAFGDTPVFQSLNLTLQNSARLAITGKNGSGKTTLLNILTSGIRDYDGNFTWVPGARIGYYTQEHKNLDLESTALEEVLQGRVDMQTEARTILGCLNLKKDKVTEKIRHFSIGERSKVALAKIILSDANVLILDEPTNHLEIAAREALEDALLAFKGTVVFVSHDRYMRNRVATEIFDMDTLQHHKEVL